MMGWGSFLWPTLVAGSRFKPISTTIAALMGDGSWVEWRIKIAAAFLSGIPPVALYFVLQKYIIEGIATTGLKS